jgi:hypothetical protein
MSNSFFVLNITVHHFIVVTIRYYINILSKILLSLLKKQIILNELCI